MSAIIAFIRGLIAKEPAVVTSAVVAAVVALAGSFGLVLDPQSVTSIVAEVITILVGGAAVRSKVSPA